MHRFLTDLAASRKLCALMALLTLLILYEMPLAFSEIPYLQTSRIFRLVLESLCMVLAFSYMKFQKQGLRKISQRIDILTRDLKSTTEERLQADTANQLKSLFLANMSHEIRTPIGIIIGLAESLNDNTLSPSARAEYIKTIEKTSKNLTRIINDILDISRVEAGHIEIDKTRFYFSEFCDDLYKMLKVKADENKNQLIFNKKGYFPFEVYTDRTRLRQILINLISNSLKFTKNGFVKMDYWSSGKTLYFDIIDNGSGIPKSFQQKLFRPFSNVRSSTDSSGLGLVLCKKIAQGLGGDVKLMESKEDLGSRFRFSFESDLEEAKIISPSLIQQVDLTRLAGKKVLIVDDVIDNQLVVRLYLSRVGMNVDNAKNGLEALEKTKNSEYDLILMDMQMPEMDGYTAVKILRGRGFNKPIIALTAHAMKEDRNKCINAGCNDYVSKPMESQVLYSKIALHLKPVNSVA